MDGACNVPYRRIGRILVDRQLITAGQLAQALVEQKHTGRPLGEICVGRYGLDRLHLADTLSEQWEEMQRAAVESAREGAAEEASVGRADADELRALLEEAEAARAKLAAKTDKLGRRVAELETLVIAVSGALTELRPVAPDQVDGNQANGPGRATTRPKRARAGARTTTRRAASA